MSIPTLCIVQNMLPLFVLSVLDNLENSAMYFVTEKNI